ncbi:hypothetical protein SADUNF_Sadunf02G0033100 [Salix dunnii]|uniref:Uncharacterized protein n=1 Tax=Salix dunnii TaxID=1413687 RepID=A0A835N5T0_9ROSI|nr:hypothetical protein SADUNF_Sadunf02G0033100 [Salix dunnii]
MADELVDSVEATRFNSAKRQRFSSIAPFYPSFSRLEVLSADKTGKLEIAQGFRVLQGFKQFNILDQNQKGPNFNRIPAMERILISLLSFYSPKKKKTVTPLLSRSCTSSDRTNTHSSASPLHSPIHILKILHQNRWPYTNPSRNIDTLVGTQQISSRQKKNKEISQLEEAFDSVVTVENMLKAFENTEPCFDERELGLALMKNPEKALSFATRALKVLDSGDDKPIFLAVMTLQLMGSVICSLKRFNDSSGCFNRTSMMLGRLEEEGTVNFEDIRPVLHTVLLELANVKTASGRREEAIYNLRSV